MGWVKRRRGRIRLEAPVYVIRHRFLPSRWPIELPRGHSKAFGKRLIASRRDNRLFLSVDRIRPTARLDSGSGLVAEWSSAAPAKHHREFSPRLGQTARAPPRRLPRTVSSWSFVNSRPTERSVDRPRQRAPPPACRESGAAPRRTPGSRDGPPDARSHRSRALRLRRRESDERKRRRSEARTAPAPRAPADAPGMASTRNPAVMAAARQPVARVRDAGRAGVRDERDAIGRRPGARAGAASSRAPPARRSWSSSCGCRSGRATSPCAACLRLR